MKTKTKTQELPSWFDGLLYPEGETVTNPFSGESYKLNATELSMYDFIKGAEYIMEMKGGPFGKDSPVIQREMIKGLDWFRRANGKAYMVLLD
tara:strand:- start:154 stop:432 length:279 start_codon:yes stop_codon:yes gene_type:complete